MPRTTLNLTPAVLAELRRRATRTKRPLGDVASEELARAFKEDKPAAKWPPLNLKTHDFGEWRVPLEDGKALWEHLDRDRLGDS
jgi:hypothetical protein